MPLGVSQNNVTLLIGATVSLIIEPQSARVFKGYFGLFKADFVLSDV